MQIEHPKPAAASITLAKARLIKIVTLAIVGLNSVGVPAILNLVPDKYQIHATTLLLVIEGAGTILSINGTEQITRERLARGTVFTAPNQAGPDESEAVTRVALDPQQLQRFQTIQPYVEVGLELAKFLKESDLPKSPSAAEDEQERILRLIREQGEG